MLDTEKRDGQGGGMTVKYKLQRKTSYAGWLDFEPQTPIANRKDALRRITNARRISGDKWRIVKTTERIIAG